jgi:uncharacterized membrane protein YkoI
MNDTTGNAPRHTSRGVKIALVAAGIAAGAIGATAIGANAVTSTGSTTSGYGKTAGTTATSGTGPQRPAGEAGRPADHGSAPVRSDEKAVTAAQAATLRAAALKAVPGGTVYRVETDAGDAAYEAHVTKADGTEVTVKFDSSLKVTKVEDGMGLGDPRQGGPHR